MDQPVSDFRPVVNYPYLDNNCGEICLHIILIEKILLLIKYKESADDNAMEAKRWSALVTTEFYN